MGPTKGYDPIKSLVCARVSVLREPAPLSLCAFHTGESAGFCLRLRIFKQSSQVQKRLILPISRRKHDAVTSFRELQIKQKGKDPFHVLDIAIRRPFCSAQPFDGKCQCTSLGKEKSPSEAGPLGLLFQISVSGTLPPHSPLAV